MPWAISPKGVVFSVVEMLGSIEVRVILPIGGDELCSITAFQGISDHQRFFDFGLFYIRFFDRWLGEGLWLRLF